MLSFFFSLRSKLDRGGGGFTAEFTEIAIRFKVAPLIPSWLNISALPRRLALSLIEFYLVLLGFERRSSLY